jgi:hypothetical protein
MRQLVEELVKRLDEVEQRRIALENSAKDADAAVTSAERRLRQALVGLSLGRWRALVSGEASIRSARAGRDASVAARRRLAVEAALQELEAARRASEGRVAEASTALRQAEEALSVFGMPASRGVADSEHLDATADHLIALRVPAPIKENLAMSTRSNVKAYQRRLVELDAEHTRAQERLAAARRKREEVQAAQDRQVQAAERELAKAVVAMAEEIGPELTANVLDIEVTEVKQLVRRAKKPSAETPAPASPANPPRAATVG